LLRKQQGGGGDYIDVAMFDSTLAFMTSAVVPYLVTGKALERTGNVGYSGQPTSALFLARDGRNISLGVVQQHQFVALAKLLDRNDWLTDPRFCNPEQRRLHSSGMQQELRQELSKRDAADWESYMSEAGIPCGMVRDVSEAASMQHLVGRNALLPLTIPGLPDSEQVQIVNAGFQMAAQGPSVSTPPPRLGQHAEKILQWLGYQEEQIIALNLGGNEDVKIQSKG